MYVLLGEKVHEFARGDNLQTLGVFLSFRVVVRKERGHRKHRRSKQRKGSHRVKEKLSYAKVKVRIYKWNVKGKEYRG